MRERVRAAPTPGPTGTVAEPYPYAHGCMNFLPGHNEKQSLVNAAASVGMTAA
jgi:hypothetical protein